MDLFLPFTSPYNSSLFLLHIQSTIYTHSSQEKKKYLQHFCWFTQYLLIFNTTYTKATPTLRSLCKNSFYCIIKICAQWDHEMDNLEEVGYRHENNCTKQDLEFRKRLCSCTPSIFYVRTLHSHKHSYIIYSTL